jgi:hypothetical protein
MDRFGHCENMEGLAARLPSEADPKERAILIRLLVEEENEFGFGRDQLAAAEKFLRAGRDRIKRQRVLIDRLSGEGLDLTQANELLRRLIQTQVLFENHRQLIVDRLEQFANKE